MAEKSQFSCRLVGLIVAFSTLPSLAEGYAIAWGQMHGMTGKALRDGLDFWAGGFLLRSGQAPMLFDHMAYQSFLQGLYGVKLPYHLWSYPPTYGLLASAFAVLPPWPDVLSWDVFSLVVLGAVLRLAGKGWGFVACVLLAPATLENALEHQNAALMTALLGGGLLLMARRPRLAGLMVGLGTIKPQLGLVLPLYMLRRAPLAVMYAVLAAVGLAVASLAVFGAGVWAGFLHFTSPAMSAVLLTGQPPDFAGGLISVFAVARPFCSVHGALLVQVVVTLACVVAGVVTRSVPVLLILGALASPYLHDYDLVGVALAVALIVEQRGRTGFAPGEPVLLFLVWFGPGLLPWMAQYAHLAPVLLVLLLASAWRRGEIAA